MGEMKRSILILIGIFLVLWGIYALVFVPSICVCPEYRKVSENCYVPIIAAAPPLYYFSSIALVSLMRLITTIVGVYLLYKGLKR
jgi:uncharacterized membrane protein